MKCQTPNSVANDGDPDQKTNIAVANTALAVAEISIKKSK